MNDNELRPRCSVRFTASPEADLDALNGSTDLREALECDSMDFLTFVEELYTRTGVDVPERDYPALASLDGCLSYLAAQARLALRSPDASGLRAATTTTSGH